MSTSSRFEVNQVGTLPEPVRDTRAISYVNDDGTEYIYTFGGTNINRSEGNENRPEIQRFDPVSGTAEVYMNLPEAIGHCVAILADNGLVYTFGGDSTTSIYEIDLDAKSITQVGTMPKYFINHDGVSKDGKIYWWGGRTADSAEGTFGDEYEPIQEFDPGSGSNTQIGTFASSDAMLDHSAVVLNDRMYSIAGQRGSSNDNTINDVFRIFTTGSYNEVNGLTLDGSSFDIGKSRMATFSGAVYAVGGRQGSNVLDGVYRFEEDFEVEQIGSLPQKADDTQAAFHRDTGNVYAPGGGQSEPGNSLDEIYEIQFPFRNVLMLAEELALEGVRPTQGDNAVMHTGDFGRADQGHPQGSDVILIDDSTAQ